MILDKNVPFTEKYYLIREELLKIIKEANNTQTIISKINHESITINKKLYKIKDIIKHLTKFLNKYDCTLSERFYYIYYDIHEVIMCQHCQTNKPKFRNLTLGYRQFCSTQCATLNSNTQEKRKQTNLDRYGVEHQMNSPKIKNKIKQTNLDRYGVEYPTQNSEILDKVIKTNIEKYGVEHSLQNKDILEKLEQTNSEKYGVKSTLQLPEVQEKISKTNSERYGSKYPTQNINVQNKTKKTNRERYGVENISQNNEVKKKKEVTYLKNFGYTTHLKNPKIKKDIQETNKKKYGFESPLQNKDILEKMKQTNKERYGVEHPLQNKDILEKAIKTNKENFGVRYASQNQEVKEKIVETVNNKYNVENISQIKEIKQKKKDTCLKNFGYTSPINSPDIRNKIYDTNQEKYGVTIPAKNNQVKEKISETQVKNFYENDLIHKEFTEEFEILFTEDEFAGTAKQKYRFKHKKCGCIFEAWIKDGLIPKCPQCSPPNNQSTQELEIREFLSEYTDNIVSNSKSIISPLELDIYLPDYNLAIEFDGLYWHSEINGKDQNYHIEKSKCCWKKKIDLLHIFEDEWNDKSQIIQNMILEKINMSPWEINIEECKIKEVSSSERDIFLEEHHIQGQIQSSCDKLYSYGLFYQDYLVSLLVLGTPRFNKNYDFEIYRFCNYSGVSIDDSFDSLLNYVIEDHNIIIYIDLRFDSGKFYKNYGFKYVGHTDPEYYYVEVGGQNPKRYNKDIIDSLEYDRIWDCGYAIYEKR